MSSGGGANYVEAWLARMRMRRQQNAASLQEADRMRDELAGRALALAITLVLLVYSVWWN